MLNIKYRTALLGLMALATPGALGCGPEFPEELIPNRKYALFEPPPAWFDQEVQKLVDVPRKDLPLVESDDPEAQRIKAETELLPVDVAAEIAAMRQAENGDAAYALGADLPEALRLYTAAAVDYHLAFPPREEGESDDYDTSASVTKPPALPYEQHQALLEQARQRFTAVLALPPRQNTERVAWASFMLGKIAAYHGNLPESVAQFQKVRELVKAGLPDPLGLAVASFGEEARLHLIPGELEQAASLYAQQLAYGSRGASDSLKILAAKIIKDTAWLDEALSRPITRSLVFLYLYTQNVRAPFYSWDDHNDDYYQQTAVNTAGAGQDGKLENPIGDTIAAAEGDNSNDNTEPQLDVWERIAASLEKQDNVEFAGEDWLAAVFYQQGRFDLARRFAARDTSPLAYWIQAKLALRAGNQEAALAAYAAAASAFPVEEEAGHDQFSPDQEYKDTPLVYRIDAERGVLRLARGEYLQALTHLYAASAQYWPDTAYVAERVLTVDELKDFVDNNVQPPSSEQVAEALTTSPAMQIRQLLARRLMREGRLAEARQYFDNPELKAWAQDYERLLKQAHYRWQGDIAKAETWFAVARLTRSKGMELLGYELAPDFFNWGGEFIDAGGPDEQDLAGEFSSDDERRRFATHRAKPEVRFHYRIVAADHAVKAADLLPHSSQAFAAVLCDATRWNLVREPDYALPLYRRYLREGPYVVWGKSFGQKCPEPDFPGAKKRQWAERFETLTHSWVTYVLPLFVFGAAIAYRAGKALPVQRSQG